MRILEEALTFDDVLLVPAYSEVLPRDVSLASQLTRDLGGGDVDPGDHAFDHGHQRAAVGFTSCGPSQHASHLPIGVFRAVSA